MTVKEFLRLLRLASAIGASKEQSESEDPLFPGIQGPAGQQGIQGAQGLTGPQGSQGLQGLQGPVGPQGPQGVQGLPADAGFSIINFNWNGLVNHYTLTQGNTLTVDTTTEPHPVMVSTMVDDYFHAPTNGARSEAVLGNDSPSNQYTIREGDETEQTVWIEFPSNYPNPADSRWGIFWQWHQTTSPLAIYLSPPAAFERHGNDLRFRLMASYYDDLEQWDGGVFWTSPIRRGEKNKYTLKSKWHRQDASAWQELYINDRLVMPRVAHRNLDGDGLVYTKMGVYRHRDIQDTETIRYSGYSLRIKRPV